MLKPIRSIVLLASFAVAGLAQNPLVNPGFETGNQGGAPPGWIASVPGYTAQIAVQGCNSGKQCVALESTAPPAANAFGTILQRLDAAPYRGKKFRYRAAVRIEGAARAQLWLRVDLAPGAVGFFDNMGDRPIRSTTWQYFDISGEIDRTGQAIFLGLLMPGAGKVWIDDASFEITGDGDPVEPARPLTSQGLQNLQALARLYGYIRFFHPTDAAAAADWNRIAIEAIRAVEPAANPAELAAKLEAVFASVAPTVRVFPTGATPPPLEAKLAPQVIFWSHHGLGISPQSAYRSGRVVKPASEASDLLEPLRSDLPGGVSSVVPLALYRDGPLPPASAPSQARPGGSGDDRTTRLAAVIIAWNVMQHFYPYFDIVQTDWPAQLPIALSAAAQDKDAAAFAITLRRMVAALHDGHGNVAGGGGGGQPSWAPPVVWTWAEGQVVALSVSGTDLVQPGDALVSIDGAPVAAVLAAKEALISGATPQWIRYRALSELLTRERGATPVQLEIDTASGRKSVTVMATTALQQLQEPRPDKVKELEPGIFYLDVNRINDADFAAALPSLVKAKGIVFDLRGYPGNIQNIAQFFGHLIKEPVTSAQWNFPEVTKPDRAGMTFSREGEWRLTPIAPYLTAKRAFIVDGRAISYAESVMGIVENYKLAEIVGEPTAGTNGNVNPLPLPGGYTITWTGMKVLKHDGSQHHGVGIHPTIPVSRTRAGIAAGRDELLERAIQAVRP